MGVDAVPSDGVPVTTTAATAFLTADARAQATTDPAQDFHDPYAARFAALCPPAIHGITRHTAGTAVVMARTVLVDRLLAELFAHGGVEACVNLGAGFDARPYRMDWPQECRVIEIDSAPVLDLKDRLLPPADCTAPLERLRGDLRDAETMVDLLMSRTAGRRCVVLAEGLLTYLSHDAVGALAAAVARLGTGTSWICDVLSVPSAESLARASRIAGTPLEMRGLADLEAFETAGWRCERIEPLPGTRWVAAPRGRVAPASRQLPDSVLRLSRY
ncbi:class I SAM-dependent methyltransferase [Streptomyces antibioticus]|uniref:class I SAM-dependent methyltransferase n=1 Tax=Streptomyces antibioticus TaxID=1890 RepID=UPI003702F723